MKAFLVLVTILAATALADLAGAEELAPEASFTEYFGYSRCVKLENENATVILCSEAGGRVLEYSWKGKNALYLDPTQKGWRYEPDRPVVEPCGGRCDIGPEMTIPRHPDLWFGQWAAEIIGPRAARLTSIEDKATGDRSNRVYILEDRKEKPLGHGDPLWIDIKCLDAKGSPAKTIPLEGGYFEMTLPKALLDGLSEPLSVQWIDFYRG